MKIEQIMNPNPFVCEPFDSLSKAARVVQQDGVVGLLSLDDLAHEAARPLRGGVNPKMRNWVADIFIAINRGHVNARSASQLPR